MDLNSLTYKTLKNISYNSLGFFISFFVTLFVTPFIVFRLGLENYGIYIFLATVSSVLGVIDFGSSTATLKFLSEYIGKNDTSSIKKIIGTMNIVYLLTGLLGFFIIVCFGFLYNFINQTRQIDSNLFLIFGFILFITISSGIIYILPAAYLRYDLSFKIGTIKLLILNLLLISSLLFGANLLGFSLIMLFVELVFLFVFRYFAKYLSGLPAWFFCFDKEEIVKVYKFGIIYFVYNFSNQILTFFDKLFIPFYLNSTQLSYYSLPGNISNKIQGLSNSFTAILLPTSSTLAGQDDYVKLKNLYSKSIRLLFVFVSAVSAVVFIYSFDLLKNWLSIDVANNANMVLKISVFTYLLLAIFGAINNYLTGLGKIKILSTVYLIMAFISILFLVILLPFFGINGAAWAYLLGVLPGIYLIYYIEKKILFFSGKERVLFYIKIFLQNLFCAVVIYLTYLLFSKQFLNNLFITLLFCGFSFILYFSIYKLFNFFEKEDLDLFKKFFISAFNNKIKKNINI